MYYHEEGQLAVANNNWLSALFGLFRRPPASARGVEEVEAEFRSARTDHTEALHKKKLVVQEFRAFEARIAAQKR